LYHNGLQNVGGKVINTLYSDHRDSGPLRCIRAFPTTAWHNIRESGNIVGEAN